MGEQSEAHYLTDDELEARIDVIYRAEALRLRREDEAVIAAAMAAQEARRQQAAAERARASQQMRQAAMDRAAREARERLAEADRRLAQRRATPDPLPPRTPEEMRDRFHRHRMPYGVTPQEPARTVAEQIAALAGDDAPDYEAAKRVLHQIAAERRELLKVCDVPAVPPVTA